MYKIIKWFVENIVAANNKNNFIEKLFWVAFFAIIAKKIAEELNIQPLLKIEK